MKISYLNLPLESWLIFITKLNPMNDCASATPEAVRRRGVTLMGQWIVITSSAFSSLSMNRAPDSVRVADLPEQSSGIWGECLLIQRAPSAINTPSNINPEVIPQTARQCLKNFCRRFQEDVRACQWPAQSATSMPRRLSLSNTCPQGIRLHRRIHLWKRFAKIIRRAPAALEITFRFRRGLELSWQLASSL